MSDTNAKTYDYNPDPEIDAGIRAEALAAERFDLSIGYAPRRWTCRCGASHARGHFYEIGVHRCLRCGYVGPLGTMTTPEDGQS